MPIRISYLINHFGRQAKHTLFATNGAYDCLSRLSDGVDVTTPEIRVEGNILSRLRTYSRFLKDLKPDLLLTYNWGSTEWALANSFSPKIRHFHLESGFGPEEAHTTMKRRDMFRRLALRNIEGIVVPSQTLVKICRENWHIPENKINYIPNGVDCDKYAVAPKDGIITGFTRTEGDVIIGTMTPLRPEKNLPRLIHAFAAVATNSPARLIIMGEGGERDRLEKLIAELGCTNKIFLPGHIEEPALALGLLDIYAISSDTEQMPNAVNQAMAAGLPIVGLDVGDVKHIVSAGNKMHIAPAGDDEAFTKRLDALVKDENLREEIGAENAVHVRETYDQSKMFEAYAGVWGL